MSNIINMQEWIKKQKEEKGTLDFGKPFEELTESEVKFLINHFKDLFNSIFKTIDLIKEIQSNNLETITQLVENSNDALNFKSEVTNLFKTMMEHNNLVDERLDVHIKLIKQLSGE